MLNSEHIIESNCCLLGQLLLTIYINELHYNITSNTMFVDDTNSRQLIRSDNDAMVLVGEQKGQ